MAAGVVQELFPALGQRLTKQSLGDEVEARVGALARHGFTSFRESAGMTTVVDHLVVSPHGIFLVYTERRSPGGSGMVTLTSYRGRFGRKVKAARWEQDAVARSLKLPSSMPVRTLLCVPGKAGASPDLFVNGMKVVTVGDLPTVMMSFPAVLSAHQVVALSALVWIRLRRR